MAAIGAPAPGSISRNTAWTKIMISHVPTHFYDPESGVLAENISSDDTLRLVAFDHIPQSFLDKHPMPCNPRWLKTRATLEKTKHRHDTIVLTVEDEDKTALEELQALGVGFGMRNGPSYITPFLEKPRMSLCLRCCSYECPNPRNCRRPVRCSLCTGKHTSAVHNERCEQCVREGFTNILDGRVCTHPPKCLACKGEHEFGDLKCERRKAYRRPVAAVLAEADAPNSEVIPSSVYGEDDDVDMDESGGAGFTNGRVGRAEAGLITQPSLPSEAASPGASSSNHVEIDA